MKNDLTSPETGPRQTLSYLLRLFKSRGIRPKNKLGQNFLIDLNLLDVVVRAAELAREDLVLEVGTGTGSLTSRLADHAGAVLSVEIDADFHSMASEALAGRQNVRLIRADILKNKNQLNPLVISQLNDLKRNPVFSRLKLVANLPYAVAAPVIANFLLSDSSFERMAAMVQLEIAERLMARPGSKDYGALTVLVQSLANVVPVRRRVPPAAFWPRPQVASAIVLIRPDPDKRRQVGDPARLRNFLRDLYTHRRKNLRGALAGLPSKRREKAEVDQMLAELGIEGSARAEDLDVEQHRRLCEAFG
jgi:16S rRNA (adenine1518-N6/adenine1519-N6)-dimethyltransferase